MKKLINRSWAAVIVLSLITLGLMLAGCGEDGGGTAPAVVAPTAPTGETATGTGGINQVSVSWTPVSGATSYNIYWSTISGVTPLTGTKITGASSPYIQTGLAASTTYFYVVTAVNSAGESAPSAQFSVTTAAPVVPAAPTGVTATGGFNQVAVSWPAVSGATSYNIYWSTISGAGTTGTKITAAVSPFAHTGLAVTTTYFYVVTAVNIAGESAPSTQVSATTTAAPVVPTPPTGVTATGGANQVSVSWTPVSGATSYNIYWSTISGAGTTGTKITGVTSPNVHSGLTAATTYFYVVTAVNAAGESAPSAQASATTTAPPALNTLTPSCASACHGLPPTTVPNVAGSPTTMPHTTNTKCGVCHVIGGWVPATTTFNMSGVATHDNGTINVLAGLPTSSCGACHGLPPVTAAHPTVAAKAYVANCGVCHLVGPGNPITMGISTHDDGVINFIP